MQIEVGEIYDGKVTGITKFGAFVDFAEGKTGMVHISEVASAFVKEITDFVKVGQAVKKGDVLVILEAMKMENEISAPHDGTVTVVASKGATVNTGDVLVTLS